MLEGCVSGGGCRGEAGCVCLESVLVGAKYDGCGVGSIGLRELEGYGSRILWGGFQPVGGGVGRSLYEACDALS